MIQSASCECLDTFCYHIGALALHTGFKTPIFTCIQDETETTESAFNTKEIEFVGLKVEKPANTIDEDVPPVKDEVCCLFKTLTYACVTLGHIA